MDGVYSLVAEAVAACGIGEELAYWIELSLSESTINAIRHGNGLDPNKLVTVGIRCDGSQIELVVEDEGKGFDLADVPDPTNGDNLLKPSGRGILIIRSFMDSVSLDRRPSGGSRLTMIKKLSQPQP